MSRTVLLALTLVASGAFAATPVVVVDGTPAVVKLLRASLKGKATVRTPPAPMSEQPTAREVRDVSGPARAAAVLIARQAGRTVKVLVLDGADGTPLDTVSTRLASRRARTLPKAAVTSLSSAIRRGSPPARPPSAAQPTPDAATEGPGPAGPTPDPAAAEPVAATSPADGPPQGEPEASVTSTPSGPAAPGLPAVTAGVGYRGIYRTLRFDGQPLAYATAPLGAMVALDAAWFPGAHFTSGVLGNLGVAVSADLMVGTTTRVAGTGGSTDQVYATSASRFRAAAVFRIPFAGNRARVDVLAGYGSYAFGFAPESPQGVPRSLMLSVHFAGPRAALAASVRVAGPLSIEVGGGFVYALTSGELPDVASTLGAEASAVIAVELVRYITARLGFDWNRYFITLDSGSGIGLGATTATDQLFTGSLTLAWVM